MCEACGCMAKEAPKPDDPCPCGSGKQYKDCCGMGK
ncbi:MAG: SEC-C metal-binding domain-containing protein [Dehalococcoidia bacterium]